MVAAWLSRSGSRDLRVRRLPAPGLMIRWQADSDRGDEGRDRRWSARYWTSRRSLCGLVQAVFAPALARPQSDRLARVEDFALGRSPRCDSERPCAPRRTA